MEDDTITEEIETGEETLSALYIEDAKCDCPECLSGRKHYICLLFLDGSLRRYNLVLIVRAVGMAL